MLSRLFRSQTQHLRQCTAPAATFCTTPSEVPAAERLPEDELAKTYAYFEALVHHWRTEKDPKWERVDKLTKPENLVMVANVFTATRQCAPEVFAKLEGRLNNESTLSALSGPYLSTLAWAFAGAGAGSPEFLKAVGKAAAGKQLEKSSKANLAWALEKAGLDAAPFKE